jgi:hypothetical protein
MLIAGSFLMKDYFPQRRQGAKRYAFQKVLLCAFAGKYNQG